MSFEELECVGQIGDTLAMTTWEIKPIPYSKERAGPRLATLVHHVGSHLLSRHRSSVKHKLSSLRKGVALSWMQRAVRCQILFFVVNTKA